MTQGVFRLLAGLIVSMVSACSPIPSAPQLTPIPGWTRPLCGPGVAVSSPWDGQIRATYARLWEVVQRDTGPQDVEVVVVQHSAPLAAVSCTRHTEAGAMTTIMLQARVMRLASTAAQPDIIIARILAHELAHLALHQGPQADSLDTVTKEYEADELGVYYYERAGFDCQQWVDGIGRWAAWGYAPLENERLTVRAACALAKQGKRPPRRIQ
jgi:hypothetical protein